MMGLSRMVPMQDLRGRKNRSRRVFCELASYKTADEWESGLSTSKADRVEGTEQEVLRKTMASHLSEIEM